MDQKNIEELLGNYMVVPEIQREYVWGSNKNIVNQFIDSIKIIKILMSDSYIPILMETKNI